MMPISSRTLVELVLLGPMDDRRQLQDSPILADVWIAFADRPAEASDLLITPYKTRSAGRVASVIATRLKEFGVPRRRGKAAHIAYLQGVVAARLYFRDVLRVLIPMTDWWQRRKAVETPNEHSAAELEKKIDVVLKVAKALSAAEDVFAAQHQSGFELAKLNPLDRYRVLATLILWAEKSGAKGCGALIEQPEKARAAAKEAVALFKSIDKTGSLSEEEEPFIWRIALNRIAMPAVARSVPAIKADAAKTLFKVDASEIAWAVVDSGIDGTHPAFLDDNNKCRVRQSFDFSNIRQIISLDNLDPATRKASIAELFPDASKKGRTDLDNTLKRLAEDADNDRSIDWGLVEGLVRIDAGKEPYSSHGTHVAGILGGRRIDPATPGATSGQPQGADGVCPNIKLFDFRVLSRSLEDTEFAVIAALQFIRYMNRRHSHLAIHGVNLSLSIPHDVRNYACGRTPVCDECERLVESGVVVVAAAGNRGYQSFETKEGAYEGYTAFSITDPGNADGVITVGSTHRFWPHTYGVSFFSSRGPTGDGRLKPDIVAPGERIEAPVPGNSWAELDGTSMAAPHVSGAAAMLMARYSELIGQPRRIKNILCESATDLGRERSFQGYGMLDVLRAFQTV
jgi:hypothetical protein